MTIPAHVQNRDVQTAQNVLDAWIQSMLDLPNELTTVTAKGGQTLRGIVAAALADVREAAYTEGVQTGRYQLGLVIVDALEGEGIRYTPSDPSTLGR